MKAVYFSILMLLVSCAEESIDQERYYQLDSDAAPFLFEILAKDCS